MKFKAIHLHNSRNLYLNKIHENSFLFNMKYHKIWVTNGISEINIFAAALEKQLSRNISKIKLSSEAATKMHFSISLFYT